MVLGDNLSSQNGSGSVRVSRGIITYTGLTPSSIAVLECDPGYRPESSLNRTCGSDGHWSEERLSCVVVDQSPEILCLYLRVNIIKLYIFRDMYCVRVCICTLVVCLHFQLLVEVTASLQLLSLCVWSS